MVSDVAIANSYTVSGAKLLFEQLNLGYLELQDYLGELHPLCFTFV